MAAVGVQLAAINPGAKSNKKLTHSTEMSNPATCTICGKVYTDRLAFNAHIKLHLKEKLKVRSELKRLEQATSPSSSPSSPSIASPAAATSSSRKRKQRSPPVTASASPPLRAPEPAPPELARIQHPVSLTPPLKVLKTHSDLMAELGACKPIPQQQLSMSVPVLVTDNLTPIKKPPPPYQMPPPPPPPPQQPRIGGAAAPQSICTPQISADHRNGDLMMMSYEMEMNRIDFNNDLSSILDQIEKDFESPGLGLTSIAMDTPPDSDSETLSLARTAPLLPATPTTPTTMTELPLALPLEPTTTPTAPLMADAQDLLGLEAFASRILLPSTSNMSQLESSRNDDTIRLVGLEQGEGENAEATANRATTADDDGKEKGRNAAVPAAAGVAGVGGQVRLAKLVQSPDSLAKVGPLPADALAVLSRLPKLFPGSSLVSHAIPGLVNVVKVERSEVPAGAAGVTPPTGYTVINIECQKRGKNGEVSGQLLESYRAVGSGPDLKLYAHQDPEVKGGEEQLLQCSFCPATFSQRSHLKRHNDDHRNGSVLYQCADCDGGKFAKKTDLIKHRRQVHSEVTQVSCPKCHESFLDPRKLSKHRKTRAECSDPRLKFACQICGKCFTQRGHLHRHEKTHGATVDDLRCRVCGKVCKNKVNLVRHRARHLACVHCSCVFENRISLQEHLLKVHPRTAIISVETTLTKELSSSTTSSTTSTTMEQLKPVLAAADSFLGSAGENDDEDSYVGGGLGESSPDVVGESLADISNSNFFKFAQELDDEFGSTNLF